MTRVQKVFCVFLCLCFLVVLAVMPEPFSLLKIIENVYRQFPLYYFIEEKTQETWLETDKQTLAQIARENGKYMGQQMQSSSFIVSVMIAAPPPQQRSAGRPLFAAELWAA